MTDDQPDSHMTGIRAASLLADILRWRLQPWTPTEQISAIRYDQDPVQDGSDRGLPYRLDHVIDTTWSDGPSGITTPEGVDKWLRFWNPWMSYWANLPSIYRDQPGPLFLQQLQENPVFANIDGWDEDDIAAWDDFTDELRAVHRRIAHATGNAPRSRGLCPRCQTGTMLQQPGPHGFDEIAVCNNRECSATIDYSQEETTASIRAIMRQYHGQDIYLPLKDLRTIWPELKASTLTTWVNRGQIQRNENGYRLADINQRKLASA